MSQVTPAVQHVTAVRAYMSERQQGLAKLAVANTPGKRRSVRWLAKHCWCCPAPQALLLLHDSTCMAYMAIFTWLRYTQQRMARLHAAAHNASACSKQLLQTSTDAGSIMCHHECLTVSYFK